MVGRFQGRDLDEAAVLDGNLSLGWQSSHCCIQEHLINILYYHRLHRNIYHLRTQLVAIPLLVPGVRYYVREL